ncbi:hypothetical protein VNO80_02721 [Phaseolus coccineus]|uniref:Secreted protein n=1 Tax=Phaseolus coccineus TaxID=3886 RepID=A0AAN9RRK1_PHACN
MSYLLSLLIPSSLSLFTHLCEQQSQIAKSFYNTKRSVLSFSAWLLKDSTLLLSVNFHPGPSLPTFHSCVILLLCHPFTLYVFTKLLIC